MVPISLPGIRTSVGEFSANYSYQKDSKQWGYGARGSVVAHSQGITLGQSIQDAFAIVHITDGDNVKIQNSGVYTDYWGNAIVPTLTNYRRNTITVNTRDVMILIFRMLLWMWFRQKGPS